MKIGKDQKVAVGRALSGVKSEDVREARLDGAAVDVAEAKAAAAELAAEVEPPGKLREYEDRIEAKSDLLREKLQGTKAGAWAVKALSYDPEKVSHAAQLVVEMKSGERVELEIPVVHLKATAMLQKSSIAAELGAFLPFAGFLVPATTSLVSLLGSGVARGLGNDEVADAMQATAKKHAVLASVGWIPGISSATSTLAVLEDRRNLRDLKNPDVGAVVQLRPLE